MKTELKRGDWVEIAVIYREIKKRIYLGKDKKGRNLYFHRAYYEGDNKKSATDGMNKKQEFCDSRNRNYTIEDSFSQTMEQYGYEVESIKLCK